MGNNIIDFNNDGYNEILELDMMPDDNFRRKTMLTENNYNTYINNDRYKYDYQYQHQHQLQFHHRHEH